MGCASSNVQEDIEQKELDTEAEALAARQRRRLTVAPHHVGEIEAMAAAAQAVAEAEVNATLSDIEVKAKGDFICISKTKKGFIPYNSKKVNQDRAIVSYALQDDDEICLFGVMDGHGEYGHYVSSFVQRRLPHWLAQEEDLKTDTKACISSAVHNMCVELRQTNISLAFSGTTAVFGVKIGSLMYVANIGDSRCVMAQDDGQGGVIALGLSEDQKPESPEEQTRILEAGGRVEPLPGPPGEDCGPHRVWLSEVDVPGLAMSRSIGDEVAQTVGVISEPVITVHETDSKDVFCIWASDGVWEFISNQEAVNLVHEHKLNLREGAQKLVQESVERWREEEAVVDDITCVIVGYRNEYAAREQAAKSDTATATSDTVTSDI